jgi:hypothetical protein
MKSVFLIAFLSLCFVAFASESADARCRSEAYDKADAEAFCERQLQCSAKTPPETMQCRGQVRRWICWCVAPTPAPSPAGGVQSRGSRVDGLLQDMGMPDATNQDEPITEDAVTEDPPPAVAVSPERPWAARRPGRLRQATPDPVAPVTPEPLVETPSDPVVSTPDRSVPIPPQNRYTKKKREKKKQPRGIDDRDIPILLGGQGRVTYRTPGPYVVIIPEIPEDVCTAEQKQGLITQAGDAVDAANENRLSADKREERVRALPRGPDTIKRTSAASEATARAWRKYKEAKKALSEAKALKVVDCDEPATGKLMPGGVPQSSGTPKPPETPKPAETPKPLITLGTTPAVTVPPTPPAPKPPKLPTAPSFTPYDAVSIPGHYCSDDEKSQKVAEAAAQLKAMTSNADRANAWYDAVAYGPAADSLTAIALQQTAKDAIREWENAQQLAQTALNEAKAVEVKECDENGVPLAVSTIGPIGTVGIPNPFEDEPSPPPTLLSDDTGTSTGIRYGTPGTDLRLELEYDKFEPDDAEEPDDSEDAGEGAGTVILGPYQKPMDGGGVSMPPLTEEGKKILEGTDDEPIDTVIPDLAPYTGAAPLEPKPTPPKPAAPPPPPPPPPAAGTSLGDILFEAGPRETTPVKKEEPKADPVETQPADRGMPLSFRGNMLYFPTQASKNEAAATLDRERQAVAAEQGAATQERNSYLYSMTAEATAAQCQAWLATLGVFSYDYAVRENAWRAISHRWMAVLEAIILVQMAYLAPMPEPTIWSMDGKEIPNPLYPGNSASLTWPNDTPVPCPREAVSLSVGPSR